MNKSRHIWTSHATYEWVTSHMNESCHRWIRHATYEWVMSHMNESCHIWMSHVTYEWVISNMNESCDVWMSRFLFSFLFSDTHMCTHTHALFLFLECIRDFVLHLLQPLSLSFSLSLFLSLSLSHVNTIHTHSSYSEGDHCPLRLSGLPAAHTFFWVIPQRPAPYFTVHSVGCLQPTPSSEWFLKARTLFHLVSEWFLSQTLSSPVENRN